jgi:hypothetical protein
MGGTGGMVQHRLSGPAGAAGLIHAATQFRIEEAAPMMHDQNRGEPISQGLSWGFG